MSARVIIVGAGAAGLGCAHRLCQAGLSDGVLVLEAGERVGGRLGSRRIGEWSVETGPATLRDAEGGLGQLIEEIGLAGEVVYSDPRARRRYLYLGGRLRLLPGTPPQLLGTDVLSLFAKLRLLGEPFIRRGGRESDETVGAFMRRRLGEEITLRLVDAVVSGIFAGDMERLSLRSAFPHLWEMEQRHGSLLGALLRERGAGRAGGRLIGFRGGMGQFAEALARAIVSKGGRIACGAPVSGVACDAAGFTVRTSVGEERAEQVVLAVPPPQAGRLLAPLDERLASAYRDIPMAPVVAISLGYRRDDVPHPLDGFGFLVPRSEGLRLLGALFMTSALPGYQQAPSGHVLLRVLYGGAHDPGAVHLSDDALLDGARRDLRITLGIEAAPRMIDIMRWQEGIEQYLVGHGERLRTIEERLAGRGLWAAGAAHRGIAVPDVLRDGARAAERVLAALGH